MTTALVAFVVAFAVSTVVTYLMRVLAPRIGAVDQPDQFRKIHTKPIPYLGGIGVFVGFLAPVLILMTGLRHLLLGQALWDVHEQFFMILAGASVALALGAWDDVREMRPILKLLFQTLAAVVAMAGHTVIWRLSLPFMGEIELGFWGIPLTLFWFLGCMNAINLLDGMDGLAGGVSLIVCITMVLVGHFMHNTVGMLLMACLGGGILGFLVHNFHPARIFLGDSGSNVIGYLIAALAIMTSRKSETAVALLIPVLALGVPIIDTSLAILRRWSHWLPFSAPDRQHIHHILLGLGFSQKRAVFLMYGASMILCAGALLSISEQRELLLMVFGALGILVFVCVRVLGAVQLRDLSNRFTRDWQRHQLVNLARIELEKCAHRAPMVEDMDTLWETFAATFELMGIDRAELATRRDGNKYEWVWCSARGGGDLSRCSNSWHVKLHIEALGVPSAQLFLAGEIDDARMFVLDRADMVWHLRDILAAELPRVRIGDGSPGEDSASPGIL